MQFRLAREDSALLVVSSCCWNFGCPAVLSMQMLYISTTGGGGGGPWLGSGLCQTDLPYSTAFWWWSSTIYIHTHTYIHWDYGNAGGLEHKHSPLPDLPSFATVNVMLSLYNVNWELIDGDILFIILQIHFNINTPPRNNTQKHV